jgi:hypothetical protein
METAVSWEKVTLLCKNAAERRCILYIYSKNEDKIDFTKVSLILNY